jgi:hypothetical protein
MYQDSGKASCGAGRYPSSTRITVTNRNDNKQSFDVTEGAVFKVLGPFDASTEFSFSNGPGDCDFHTSCSVPLVAGDQIGPFKLLAGNECNVLDNAAIVEIGGGFCFSGDSLATVESKGLVAMKNLELGDKVLVGEKMYEPVYSFGHRLDSTVGDYLLLLPSKLEISRDHMIFVEGGTAVPASKLKVGDRLENGEEIKMIQSVVRRGLYAPFTPSGSVVVNGVRASSFVAFQDSAYLKIGSFATPFSYQWLAHTFEAPHRLWCFHLGGNCLKEQYSQYGISKWVQAPLNVMLWFLNQHPLIVLAALLPLLGTGLVFLAIETAASNPSFYLAAVALLVVAMDVCRRQRVGLAIKSV